MKRPILYSFRRCPYAIRARLALREQGVTVILREVALRSKPQAMLDLSSKATVPILLLPDGYVLENSLDIMLWVSGKEWFDDVARDLIRYNDDVFKLCLDRYKYADRFPEQPIEAYRSAGEVFLAQLDARLEQQNFLAGDKPSLLDWAILPFIRQFSMVDIQWFDSSPYIALRRWLTYGLKSQLFIDVMQIYPVWHEGDRELFF